MPLLLGGLALAVMTIMSMLASRKKRLGKQQSVGHARILIHAINDDRCTGCDACVAVCPTNVLDLIQNKSRVLRFQDCIQCEACMWACPTEALVMFPEGTMPPPVRTPDLDANFQTVIPGQYLIGEVAGKPLVKNAANLGRAVVEHMLQTGLRSAQSSSTQVDVLIVGSGPGGMSAALTCRQRGLSYLVIEKENIISSTVSRYPKGKHVMAEPYETANYSYLPVIDSTKEEMIALWQDLAKRVDLQIRMHETVQSVFKQQDGTFLTTTTGAQYRSQRIVLATGTRGKPRTLGVNGENFPKVESLLEDPDAHYGKTVCVVGGGDSALEAALALSAGGAKVILSYRGKSFHRAQVKNRKLVDQAGTQGKLKVKLQSQVIEFGQDTVTLEMGDGTQKRYPNQAAFVLIGADPPIQWLSTLGIHYVERPHMAPTPASDALVKMLIPDAQECPQNSEDAASLIFGQAVEPAITKLPTKQKQASHRQHPRSRSSVSSVGRKFMRSASSLFRISDENKRPIPLSEFAKMGQEGRSSPRDQLDAGERTRILRMLRDEGGRVADEESAVHDIGRMQASPEWNARRQAAEEPKQALIVGLAKATASAPSNRKQRPMAFEPEIQDEKTEHMSLDEARSLVLNSAQPSGQPMPSAPYSEGLGGEEATQFSDFDPSSFSQQTPQVQEEQPFYDMNGVEEEATVNVSVESLLQNEQRHRPAHHADDAPYTSAAPPKAYPAGEHGEDFTPAPQPYTPTPEFYTPTPEFDFEEKTRVADEDFEPHSRSLSEVEWDLD